MQIPKGSSQGTGLIVNEKRVVGAVSDDAVELIDDGPRQGLRRQLQAQIFQAAHFEQVAVSGIVFARLPQVQHRAITVLPEPIDPI